MSMFRESPLPDGTKGPVSFRRVAAAWCALIFGFATIAVVLNMHTILSLAGPAVGVVAVLVGFPLAGLLFLLFFTTWADIAAIVAAYKKP